MGWPLVIIGIILVVAGVRDETERFTGIIKEDFTGQPNFVLWMAAIFAVGSLGSIRQMKPVSDAFMLLIGIVLIMSNRGFFAELTRQLNTPANIRSN